VAVEHENSIGLKPLKRHADSEELNKRQVNGYLLNWESSLFLERFSS
jgi:hypothetical protein